MKKQMRQLTTFGLMAAVGLAAALGRGLAQEPAPSDLERLQQEVYDVVITDLRLPGADGLQVLRTSKGLCPDTPVIIITAYATVDTAIAAMKEGAQEYVVKPCHPQEISLLVERIVRVKNLERENAILRRKLNDFGALPIDDTARFEIRFRLLQKEREFQQAILLASSIRIEALASDGVEQRGGPLGREIGGTERRQPAADLRRGELRDVDGRENRGDADADPAQGGASGYIVKPFTKATLEEKVTKILEKAAA